MAPKMPEVRKGKIKRQRPAVVRDVEYADAGQDKINIKQKSAAVATSESLPMDR